MATVLKQERPGQGRAVGIRLTDRDRELFVWINGHGFATVLQISRWMDVHYQTAQRRVQRLVKHGYLQTVRLLHGEPAAVWPTMKGWRESGDDLKPLRQVSFGGFYHDRMLVDVVQAMLRKRPDHRLITARRLRRQQWEKNPVLGAGHVADGHLVAPDDYRIVIELELTAKNKDALKKIIRDHAADLDNDEVWYVVTDPAVERLVKRYTQGHEDGFFKIFTWREPTP